MKTETKNDLTRGILHAQSLSQMCTSPAPEEWKEIEVVADQKPMKGDADTVNLHQLDEATNICTWMVKRGHLWYIASDFFKIDTF